MRLVKLACLLVPLTLFGCNDADRDLTEPGPPPPPDPQEASIDGDNVLEAAPETPAHGTTGPVVDSGSTVDPETGEPATEDTANDDSATAYPTREEPE